MAFSSFRLRQQLFEPVQVTPTESDLNDRSGQEPNHPVKKSIPRILQRYHGAFPPNGNAVNRANGRFWRGSAICRKCGEIVPANEYPRSLPNDFQRKVTRNMPRPIDLQRMLESSVPDAVAIDFALCRKSGVESGPGYLAAQHPQLAGQIRVERSRPHFARKFSSGNVNVRNLSHRMDPGIRAASAVDLRGRSQNLPEGRNQMVLDRVSTRLALPPRKSSPVVRDREAQSFTGRNSLFHSMIKNVFSSRFWLRKLTGKAHRGRGPLYFLVQPAEPGPD